MTVGAIKADGAVSEVLYLTPQEIPARFGNVPSLDGLRALSILIVMASHFVNPHLIPGGFGVLVFFVISGFLITRQLFAELKQANCVSIKNFYLRRVFRLYPVIVVYTLVSVSVYAAGGHKITWSEPLSALFYFANYLYAYYTIPGHTGGSMPFGIFWSLSVEEHFYLFFPLLFVAVSN